MKITFLAFFLLSLRFLSIRCSSLGSYVEIQKCRYCREGNTHTLMMFLKYDKSSYDKEQLKLSFHIEDGTKPRLVKFDKDGNELARTDIQGINLAQLRAKIAEFGIEPKQGLKDPEFLEEQWRSHLNSKNIKYEEHDLQLPNF